MSLSQLLAHMKQSAALGQVAGLLSWDQEVMMPPKGGAQRAEQAGAMAAVIHARDADPRVPEWIAGIDRAALSPFDQRNVAEAERAYRHATLIPQSLAEEIAVAASTGQRIWAKAREVDDFKSFAPALERNILLKRQEAACLADGGGDPYDALLDQFEPGATTAELLPMLQSLRPGLTELRQKIAEKPAPASLAGTFDAEAQMTLASRIAGEIGYDFDAGRLDRAVHPFSSGTADDARITTRTDEANPFDCLFSTVHEVGHALYAQGVPDPFQPAANYCSMGVHESQSRFWENQIARSRPFADRLYPAMVAAFGPLNVDDADALYAAANRVETGFIRTEADEVHYNIHILLRFDLERALIAGDLAVGDLEAAWNTRFEQDFGIAVPAARLGVLQDVHWSVGLFGYFPTYSLGNVYAACIDRAMRTDLPDRDTMVRAGETAPILAWLRQKIHKRGRILAAPDLIAEVTGQAATVDPLLDYLNEKFGTLYDL